MYSTAIVAEGPVVVSESLRPPPQHSLIVGALAALFAACRHKVDRPSRYADVLSGKKPEDNIKLGDLRDAVKAGASPRLAKVILDLERARYRALITDGLPPKHVLMRRETETEGRLNNAQMAWIMSPCCTTLREYRLVLREYAHLLEMIETRCELDEKAASSGRAS